MKRRQNYWFARGEFPGSTTVSGMKEIQMFPQITEETEENLLTLEEVEQPQREDSNENKSPSPPSSHSSNVSTNGTTPGDTSLSTIPTDENHVPGPVPKIVAEDVDVNNKKKSDYHTVNIENEVNTPPPRVRIRSLSGGAYRLSPVPNSSGRTRRQSGDDVLAGASPSRRPAFFEAFRPRSKSDSKGKRPTFLSTLKNSFFSTSANQHYHPHNNPRKISDGQQPIDDVESLECGTEVYRQRSRSGSEAKGAGPMSKMMDMFRNRSNSISIDQRNKKHSNTTMPGSALIRRYSVEPDKRRHPLVSTHRSLELPQDLQANSYHRLEAEKDLSNQDDTIISRYFDYKRCYDVMPVSGKVVVLEVHLQVEKAFHSLVTHLIRAAPLWDSTKMAFIGMLTITDFIDILLYYASEKKEIEDLERHKIFEWRRITNKPDNFIYIQPEASLTDAIKLLVQKKVHRLPIYCPKQHAVLFVLTHKRILKYFYLFGLGKSGVKPDLHSIPACFKTTIRDLKIGTYDNIATASLNMTVIDALKIFAERKVSALPVIENGSVVNIYAKFDVLALAKGKSYGNLTLTIKEALSERGEICEEVVTCTLDDTLEAVLIKIIDSEVHRLVVVDENKSVVGMLSLSDILKFLVLKPLGLLDVPVSSVEDSKSTADADRELCSESLDGILESNDLQQTVCSEESTNNIASSDSSPKFETLHDSSSELVTYSPSLHEDNLEDVLENVKNEN